MLQIVDIVNIFSLPISLTFLPVLRKYTQPIHQFLNYNYHYYYGLVRLSPFVVVVVVVRTSGFNYGVLSSNVLQ